MISAFANLAAAGLNLADTVEKNLNRPDMVKAAVARTRQAHRDAVDAAQAVYQNPKSTQADKDHALDFIRRASSK